MIECIFTIDYEIYGNGEGSLHELIYEPAEKLMALFRRWNMRFVPFVEVAELEMIEAAGSDKAIDLVKKQIWDFHRDGFELGLHIHPQWYNARYENGRWIPDYAEYNLCTLPRKRIIQIVDRSITYFRNILDDPDFTPLAFRAGNWLFQPTQPAAEVLVQRGLRVDSSVFKGGLQNQHKLDYRSAVRNGYYWSFLKYVDVPDPMGPLLELPIYTQMVPFWRMLTVKRVGLQQKVPLSNQRSIGKLFRLMDVLRLKYPLKLDFCRMTTSELSKMIDKVINEEQKDSTAIRPIVAIGHTKDLVDFGTVEWFLSYLREKQIRVTTFRNVYQNTLKLM
jgi:hypothetical protein